jgi:DNA end-binding protein Ku
MMGVSHKGAISLGLLYIPVGLYTTTRDNDLKSNQLCKDTKGKYGDLKKLETLEQSPFQITASPCFDKSNYII